MKVRQSLRKKKKRPAQNPGESDVFFFRIIIIWNREIEKESGQEKVMQAAETYSRKRPDSQQTNSRRTAVSHSSFFSRAAGLAILLVLCVIGVTSINRYNDMKEAGNMFAGAAGQLDNNGEEKAAAGSGENDRLLDRRKTGSPA